ncbi:MAG: hypothetical protein KJ941_05705, partial [Bacteroidetes bacterium]|nr:hypothetical protein [Bacteroidota bacterium]
MIILKNLVILNTPKTGGSFVRKVVRDIYLQRKNRNIISRIAFKLGLWKSRYLEIMHPHPKFKHTKDQHG